MRKIFTSAALAALVAFSSVGTAQAAHPAVAESPASVAFVEAHTAGTKPVGAATNTWGTAVGVPYASVWTEVRLPDGRWSVSQTRETDENGYFVIPLTYGINTVGTTTYRVGVFAPDGVAYSAPFTLTRTAAVSVTAYSAGTKRVGQATNTWGTAKGAPNATVWTEVRLSGGRWSRSQVRRTSSTGGFVIPLTYGINTVGTTTYRVGVSTRVGAVYSNQITLRRTAVVAPKPTPRPVYYANCAAAWADGAAPLRVGDPGYRVELDRDRDGVACEVRP